MLDKLVNKMRDMIDLKAPSDTQNPVPGNVAGNEALAASAKAQMAPETATMSGGGDGNQEAKASDIPVANEPDDDEAPRNADIGGDDAIPEAELTRITSDVIRNLKTVYDPEIPVDIYELGLIYKVDLGDDRTLAVDMTLTAPGCPVAGEMPGWVEGALRGIEGVEDVKVDMVFDPPWTPDRMSDEAKLELGWM